MILVTGGAGFIGSNLIRTLNSVGRSDILVVDDLRDGTKALNLSNCVIADFVDIETCLRKLEASQEISESPIEQVYHLGACSDTTQWDASFLMRVNFTFTKLLFKYCMERAVGMVYASSAAVYGSAREFREEAACEKPLNPYGYSKLVFDQYFRRQLGGLTAPVIGLRYFNVYGPYETHKGRMASVVYHFHHQIKKTGRAQLFGASHGCADGEHRRDFIYVKDVVDVTLWCGTQPLERSGIYNCGTGCARSFNDVGHTLMAQLGHGAIEYVPFPSDLLLAYQAHTQADLSRFSDLRFPGGFTSLESGIAEYVNWLDS